MSKKAYDVPETSVIELGTRLSILGGSNEGGGGNEVYSVRPKKQGVFLDPEEDF